MSRLLKLLPLLLLLLFFTPTSVQALACGWDTAGEDLLLTTVTPKNIDVFISDKATDGFARFQGDVIDYCIGTDDAGGVTIEFLDTAGVTLATQAASDDGDYTYTPNTSYVGPVRIKVTDSVAATVTSNYLFFVAPDVPKDAAACTTGVNNSCFLFDPLPSYALGGQVYNQFFNLALQTLYDAGSPLPKDPYFPNLVYETQAKEGIDVLGIYANDTTYATDAHIIGKWVIFYWWLTAGSEGFPDWDITFSNSALATAGDTIDLNTLMGAQDRTFTSGTDYYGYTVLVTDRVITDFISTGWFAQLDLSLVGSPTHFYGTWHPVNSGTYSGASTTIPNSLNGGYLQLVAEPTDTSIQLDLSTSPPNVTSGTGLIYTNDSIISGEVNFHRGTNSRAVDYIVELRAETGQLLQTMELANTDGFILDRVPFAFLEPSPLSAGKLLVREFADSKRPAILVEFLHDPLERFLVPPVADGGLSRYLADVSITNSEVTQAFTGFAAAWGLSTQAGNTVIALTATGILIISVLVFIRIIAVGIFAAFLSLLFFTFIGLLPPSWFLLLTIAIIIGISWKLFGATA